MGDMRERIARVLHAWDVEGGPCEVPWDDLTSAQREVWRSGADALIGAGVVLDPWPVEFGIVRPASMPDMSGKPTYTQIVGATFRTLEAAEVARRHVPPLRDHPALIVQRRAPGEWEAVTGDEA